MYLAFCFFIFSVNQVFAIKDLNEDLINIINKYAIFDKDGFICEAYPGYEAYYNPVFNVLHLCEKNINYNFETDNFFVGVDKNKWIRSTLIHEMIHIAQDCYAGGIESNQITHIVEYPVNKYVARDYPESDHLIETEAYWYYHQEEKNALALLKYCE